MLVRMGTGASAAEAKQEKDLRMGQERLQASRVEIRKKDQQLQRVRRQVSELEDYRKRLEAGEAKVHTELEAAREAQMQDLSRLRVKFLVEAGEESQRRGEAEDEAFAEAQGMYNRCVDTLAREAALEQERRREAVTSSEAGASNARTQLRSARASVRRVAAERDAELEAATAVGEEHARESGLQRQSHEERLAEFRQWNSEVKSSRHSRRCLGLELRSLKQVLGDVSKSVDERSEELERKERELMQVRKSVRSIEDGMDVAQAHLTAECARVEGVEESLCLTLKQELGERVLAMHQRLQESHTAMVGLGDALRAERAQRAHFDVGLTQQRVRTELLVQLLDQVKGRTLDLTSCSFSSEYAEQSVQRGDHSGDTKAPESRATTHSGLSTPSPIKPVTRAFDVATPPRYHGAGGTQYGMSSDPCWGAGVNELGPHGFVREEHEGRDGRANQSFVVRHYDCSTRTNLMGSARLVQ